MNIVYVPLNKDSRVSDTRNPEIPGFPELKQAYQYGLEHIEGATVIAMCADYEEVDDPVGPIRRRIFLGWTDEQFIPGIPDDGEWLVKTLSGDIMIRERIDDTWWDDLYNSDPGLRVVGYRPLM